MKYTLLLIFLLTTSAFAELTIPAVVPNSFIQDHAQVLNEQDEKEVEHILREFQSKYNLEFGAAIVDSLGGYSIEEYALKMARQYGVGSKLNEKRGMLLLISTKDRKWRFEISRHMEGVITDAQSASIGRNALTPKLKIAINNSTSENWKSALLTTLNKTDKLIESNIEPEVKDASTQDRRSSLLVAILVILGITGIGCGGFGIFYWWSNKKEKEDQLKAEQEATKRREQRAAYLKSPEGVEYTKRQEELNPQQAEKRKKEYEERQAWLLTPAGKGSIALEKERKQKRKKENQRRAKRNESNSSSYSSGYSSSDYSSSSSSSYSSDSSSSGFGGSSDYSGGGSSGDF